MAPHLADVDLARVTRDIGVALVPCVLIALSAAADESWSAVLQRVTVFAVALVAGGFWLRVFSVARERSRSVGILTTALIFALLLPADVPLWQVGLGMSFGVVFGQEVFGGSGRSFVHPVVIALVFLQFTYPDGVSGAPTHTPAFAVALGAAWLLFRGSVRWRVIGGCVAGYLAAAACVWGSGDWIREPALGTIAFGLVFLSADPLTAAATGAGRWFQGALVGAFVVLLQSANPELGQPVAMAILFASVCAPTVDLAAQHLRARRAEVQSG